MDYNDWAKKFGAPIKPYDPAQAPSASSSFVMPELRQNAAGEATHANVPASGTVPPPPSAPPAGRIAAPQHGPLVDNNGTATHEGPSILPPPDETQAEAPPLYTAPAAPAPPPPNPVNTALRDALLRMLNQPDPSMDDPIIKAQSEAFSLAQTRAKQRDREAMAGRAAQSGYLSDQAGSGMFDQGLSNLEQRQGEAEGAFNANLLGTELQNRRNQLLSAAAMAGDQLNQEQVLAFQKELAQVDEELQRLRIGQSGQALALDERRVNEASQQWSQQFGMEGQKLAETIRQFDTTTQMGRDQLKQSLEMFKTQMGEQGRQFDVDAELKRLGITTQGALGSEDNAIRRLGTEGNLNLGLLSALFQNNQFGQGLGANVGMFNASQNNSFLSALLNMLGQAA